MYCQSLVEIKNQCDLLLMSYPLLRFKMDGPMEYSNEWLRNYKYTLIQALKEWKVIQLKPKEKDDK